MKYLFLILISFTLLFTSCNDNDSMDGLHSVEMRVESEGDFKVWWNYTGNPDADADWLTQPPILHQNYFQRAFLLERGDFYALKVESVNDTEYTVTILVDGNVIQEQTTNDYTFIDRTFFP